MGLESGSRRGRGAAVMAAGLALVLAVVVSSRDGSPDAELTTFAASEPSTTTIRVTHESLIDATPDLSGPSHVRYSISRTVGDVEVRVDIEDDSPMLRIIHERYKTAPKPSSSVFVRWPIPTGCYPDQSYTMTIQSPDTSVPFVARNYDYRFNTPFSMRIASHYGIPPTYESGLVYAIVRVHSPDIAALRLVVNDRIIDEMAVRNPTEIVVGLMARSELTSTNVRVQSIDAHGIVLGDETPFRPYGVGTDPPANVVDCF